MRSEKVLALMMTKTSSREWAISSKLTVPLKGLSCWRQIEPFGQMKPLALVAPGTRASGARFIVGEKTHGSVSPVVELMNPPQNDRSGVKAASKFVGSSGLIQVHWRLKLDLKLCTPTIANSSQKKPMRNETRTSSGADFFRLLRII